MKNNKKVIMSLVVTSLVLITAGVTYAFFSYSRTGTTENAIRMGDITFLYEEIDKQGNGINIVDAVPVSDETGKQGRAFNFRITSTNTVNAPIPYQITARKVTGIENPLPDDAVKVYLTKVDSNDTTQETQVLLEKYSELPTLVYNNHDDEILWTDQVPAGSSNYSQSYRLRMWIAQDTDFSTGQYTDKQFSIKVNVYGGTAMQPEPDAPEITNITIPDGTVSPVLDTTLGYDYITSELPSGTTSTTLNITTEDANDQVTVERVDGLGLNDTQSNIQRLSTTHNMPITLTGNNNYFKITVRGTSKKKIEKIIKVVVAKSNIASLSSLSISNCDIGTFSSNTTAYTCTTSKDSLTVNAVATNNGTYTVTGNTGLQTGTNTLTITVTAENGIATQQYTVTVTKIENPTLLSDAIFTNYPLASVKTNPNITTIATTNDSGLYSMNVTNGFGGQSTQGTTYYFRGNVTNNYVSFAGFTWRVVRINEDGTIRLILQNIIDDNTSYMFNSDISSINNMYYSNSTELKGMVDSWYNTNIDKYMSGNSGTKYSDYVASGNYFCEAARVKENASWGSGSANMLTPSNYTPDLVCQADGNGMGFVPGSIGLITYDEVVYAGGYYNTENSTFYLNNAKTMWTMSPCGMWSNAKVLVWSLDSGKKLYRWYTNYEYAIRPVINLSSNVKVTGNGTIDNKWQVIYE